MGGKTLYVSDLDGTLLLPDQTIGGYTRELLSRLTAERALCFTVATARSMATVRPLTEGLSLTAPLVLTNGSCIYDLQSGNYLDVQYFTPEQADALLRSISQVPLNVFVFTLPHMTRTAAHGNPIVAYHRTLERAFDRSFRDDRSLREGDKCFRQVQSYDEVPRDKVFYASMNGPKALLEPLHAALSAIDGVGTVFYMDRYDEAVWYLELFAATASKAYAVRRVAEIVGADRIVSFGDNTNDAGMFAVSDECYAVENAVPALAQLATGRIRSNAEEGVARFLAERFSLDRSDLNA